MALIVPALNVHERIGMLSGMKVGTPPEVFDAGCAIAKGVRGDEWAPAEPALS